MKLPAEVPADGFHVYVSPNNAGALDFVYQVYTGPDAATPTTLPIIPSLGDASHISPLPT